VDGLEPGVTYYFTVATETDPHINNLNRVVSEPGAESTAATEFINEETTFDSSADFISNPELIEETPFNGLQAADGFDPTQDAVLVTADAGISNADALTLTSFNASWRNAEDDGVFMWLSAWGDFIAEVTVSSMDALAGHGVGLMVRVPTADGLDAAGPGQDYVTLGVSGGINQIEQYGRR
jgi:hypothetical protein